MMSMSLDAFDAEVVPQELVVAPEKGARMYVAQTLQQWEIDAVMSLVVASETDVPRTLWTTELVQQWKPWDAAVVPQEQ